MNSEHLNINKRATENLESSKALQGPNAWNITGIQIPQTLQPPRVEEIETKESGSADEIDS
jgi:hypothetical protein